MRNVNQLIESTKIKKNELELTIGIKNLMEELRVYKLVTRKSFNEFISRHILISYNDIDEYIDIYKKTGIVISFESNNKKIELKIEDLIDFIGFCPFKHVIFNYNWTQKQFISNFFPLHFRKIENLPKDRLFTDDYLYKLNNKVNKITNRIDENIFKLFNSSIPAEKEDFFDCKDLNKLFCFYAPNTISEENYQSIIQNLLSKTDFYNFKNDTDEAYTDDMFKKIDIANEIISIGYAVKNRIISPKAIIGKIDYDSNPFFEINHLRLFDDFINKLSFEAILQKWNFDTWKDLIPVL